MNELQKSVLDGIAARWTDHISVWVDLPGGLKVRVGWSCKGMGKTCVALYRHNGLRLVECSRWDFSNDYAARMFSGPVILPEDFPVALLPLERGGAR